MESSKSVPAPPSSRRDPMAKLRYAEDKHRELDERLRTLGTRPYLSPAETREIAELKKKKLAAKDEIAALRQSVGRVAML